MISLMTPPYHLPPLSADEVWARLCAARRGRAEPLPEGRALSPEARQLLALFSPIVEAESARALYVVAHLAQSLDGRIATRSGASQWITGEEDLTHCHRLRALSDAVLIGVETAVLDRPRLTVRRVLGEDPLRVVLDPRGRLPPCDPLLSDGVPTLQICDQSLGRADGPERLALPGEGGRIPPQMILDALVERGVRRLYIEGGGVTLSGFLAARCVDRLHLAVAPLILGSGRPGFQLPEIQDLSGGLRLKLTCYPLGGDILLDCELPR